MSDKQAIESWLADYNLRVQDNHHDRNQMNSPSLHSWIEKGRTLSPTLREHLRNILKDRVNDDILPQTILAIGLVGDDTDAVAIRPFLHYDDVYARTQAITSIATLGAGEALLEIIGCAVCDPDENVRASACTSMLSLREPDKWRYTRSAQAPREIVRAHWHTLALAACETLSTTDESEFVRDVARQTRASLLERRDN